MADLQASGPSITGSPGNNNSNRNPPEIDVKNLPAGRLLKTRDLPSKSIPWDQVELPVDALLLTVKDCELESCVSFLNPGFYKSYHIKLGFVYFGKIGEKGNARKIALTKCEMGSNGSTLTVKNTVEKVKPKAVFCVGYCGGLNATKVQLGDVVISSKLRTYADIKITQNEIQYRGIGVPLKQYLARLILDADAGWNPPLKNDDDLDVDVIKNGVILSGPEVVDNVERRRELTKQFPDATAIEMEGVGLHAAARDLDMEWVVIKGVSDFADGKKSDTDKWRPFASVMAASLTAHILSDPNSFKDVTHYEGAVTKDAQTQTEITMNDILFEQSVITTSQRENPDGESLGEGLKRKAADDSDQVAKRHK